jgi:hypothetical protein
MTDQNTYIIIAVLAFLFVLFLLFICCRDKKKKNNISSLGGIAMALVITGIIFGESRMIGYFLIGFGLLLAVIDIFKKIKESNK